MVSHLSVLAPTDTSASLMPPHPSFFLSKCYPPFQAQQHKEASQSSSPLWTLTAPFAVSLCVTHSSLAGSTGRCAPGPFLQANCQLTEGRTTWTSLQHLGQLPAKHSCTRYGLLNFIIILNFNREIAAILVWHPTDSQISRAIVEKLFFMRKPSPISVKCFQMLCREPIIPFQQSTRMRLYPCFRCNP